MSLIFFQLFLIVQTEKSPYQYRGMFHALSTVLRQEGPRALYKGWLPSVIGVVSRISSFHWHGGSFFKAAFPRIDIRFSLILFNILLSFHQGEPSDSVNVQE